MTLTLTDDEYLAHYGTPRHSGRYPWGSGDNVTQRSRDLLANIQKLRDQGLTDTEIAKSFKMTTTEYRAQRSIAKNAAKAADIAQATRLKAEGYSNVEIGKVMFRPESSVRALLVPSAKDRNDVLTTTASLLKSQIDENNYLDVGRGTEKHLDISADKLKTAVAVLQTEGYVLGKVKVPQLGSAGNFTTTKVLAPPGTPYKEIYNHRERIQVVNARSDDGGRTFDDFQPPLNISSRRIAINYKEDGGDKADGVIYIRPGVEDVSIGNDRYAQVRISVDGTHYLKGMAVYKDDLPPGVDLVFNTNKTSTGNKKDAMKGLNDDPTSPFGAVVDQIIKRDPAGNPIRTPDGKTIVTSAMNIVSKEGDWEGWTRTLASQMLSKQRPRLIKTQLDATYEAKKNGLDEISALTNPSVRIKLLTGYSEALDASASHLEAAQMPRQGWHVIMPVNGLKDTEIYAPNFRNGERVVLIRYPHGGTFEIPELLVNNNHRESKSLLGRAQDAVGINSKVAERLSGADFDGDTVLVIPNGDNHVKTSPALTGLKDFDPKAAYPKYDGMPKMKPQTKQNEMGNISNLITDMTIKGASPSEVARAVRHSMVVIDAEKHELNYKQSAIDNGIPQLKEKYQGSKRAGAATLISRAESEIRIPKRGPRYESEGGPIDKATGKKMYREEPESFIGRDGKLVVKTRSSTKLREEEDAFKLSSGTAVEALYATHSNKIKALANDARKQLVNTKVNRRDPAAAKYYADEVDSLNAKLNIALRNAPLERKAQLVANTRVSARRAAHPEMDSASLKKIESQELIKARRSTGAEKQDIMITDREWAAIQANAISPSKLTQILDKSNLERVKQLATPKQPVLMTSAKQQRAQAMLASGYTQAQVADALGVSLTTLKTAMKEGS